MECRFCTWHFAFYFMKGEEIVNINLYINKQSARAEAPEIFSGSVGVLTVTLFGELDSSLTPVLRFMHESGEGYYTAKIENGCATVPHEVIHAPGFSIAVAGYENDGEEVIRFLPSEAVYISVKENGYGSPDDAVSEEEASQSLIGQILSECQSVRGEVTDAKNAMSQELSDAKDEMTDSILYAKEELNRKYSSIKNELEDMADVVLSEEEAREKADSALEAAVGKERSDREMADGELLTALDTEAKARADADSALEAAVGKEKTDRETAETELSERLDGKVDKEEGKGLSEVKNIYTHQEIFDEETYGNNVRTVEIGWSLNDKEETTVSDVTVFTADSVVSLLREKVDKEEGKGLSEIESVSFGYMGSNDMWGEDDYYRTIDITYQDGRTDSLSVYEQSTVKNKLSRYYTKAEVEAYIEETLLGGAW